MSVGLLGRKVGMTQVYIEDGSAVPVTVVELGPCTVLQLRTVERDGYAAVQLGFADKPRRLANRAERGHVAALGGKRAKARAAAGVAPVAKANCEPQRYIREFRIDALDGGGIDAGCEVGQTLTVAHLAEVSHVDIIGLNKGRGTAGVMKQHNFHGLRASHGVQRHHRAGGSIGGHGTNRGHSGKIRKGKLMAGRWGNERVTVRNIKVVRIDEANNVILLNGSVPGPIGGFVMVRQTRKKKRPQPQK
ncbi:MAG: 50S ribosomal protein L3 [Planctomycetaceae bacterium]|nr:50S ribosomal protein L3 [Planctomycetaceae bacterium]